MAVYARKDGTLFVQFYYKGKTYIKSTGGKNKTKAAALETKMRADLFDQEVLGNPSEITLQAAIEMYLEKNKDKTVIESYTSTGRWFSKQAKNMMLHDVTTVWLHNTLEQKRNEGAANGTLKYYLQFISNVTNNASNSGFRVSPYTKPKIAQTKSRLRFLSLDEETRLLNALDVNHPDCRLHNYSTDHKRHYSLIQDDRDLVIILLDTGARLNEIQKIEWSKIDLVNKEIHIWRSKVSNESYLKMTDRVYEVLARRKKSAVTKFVFSDSMGSYRKSSQGLRSTMNAIGLGGCTIHTLRHTHASRLVQAGVSLYEVQQLLGHTNINTTMRYSHLSQADITTKAVDVLNTINSK